MGNLKYLLVIPGVKQTDRQIYSIDIIVFVLLTSNNLYTDLIFYSVKNWQMPIMYKAQLQISNKDSLTLIMPETVLYMLPMISEQNVGSGDMHISYVSVPAGFVTLGSIVTYVCLSFCNFKIEGCTR